MAIDDFTRERNSVHRTLTLLNCAALTLKLDASPQWSWTATISRARFISNVEFNVEVGRTRTKKPVQGARTKFTARAQWA